MNHRVILVGRHAGVVDGFDVVGQRNIEWALDRDTCLKQLASIEVEAKAQNCDILLQNVPGILAAALVWTESQMSDWGGFRLHFPTIGVMVSRPGARVAGASVSFSVDEFAAASAMANAIKFSNGRASAKIDMVQTYDSELGLASLVGYTVTVTVDPVTPFVLDHVEWFAPSIAASHAQWGGLNTI